MFSNYNHIWTSAIKCGSRVTCNPAPPDTDEDWLVLYPEERFQELHDVLYLDGWSLGGSFMAGSFNQSNPDEQFRSYTKEINGIKRNLICTSSEIFHKRFWAATTVSTRLNLMNKDDRIALFQAVLYANPDRNSDLPF